MSFPEWGRTLFNHLSAQITFKVKDGMTLTSDADAARFCLHYTSHGSSEVNDMLLRTTPMVDERPERVPGLRTKFPQRGCSSGPGGANLVHARTT